MKRVLWGSLFALMLQLGFTPVTNAAEIPPTAECTSTFKTLLRTQMEEISGKVTDKQERQAERRLIKGLADAGCVSDAEPLLNPMPAKPFSPECAAAATAADDFWAPSTKQVVALYKTYRKTVKPFNRKIATINRKIVRLKKRGGEGREIKRLNKLKWQYRLKASRKAGRIEKKLMPIIAKDAYATTLVIYEFISLRCVDDSFAMDGKPKDPVARTLRKNGPLIWGSVFYVWGKAMQTVEGDAQLSSASVTPMDMSGMAVPREGAYLKSVLPQP